MLREGHVQLGEVKRGKLKRWIRLMYFLYKNEYRIYKPVEITIRRGPRLKGEKQRWTNFIFKLKFHKETPCITIFNKQKWHFVFFYKVWEQEGRIGLFWEIGTSGKGKDVGKGGGRWIWYKYCIHRYVNEKMIPVETIPEMRGVGIKESVKGMNSSLICLIYCKNFCKCNNVPQHTSKKNP
jgi:hypothetical protein